MGSFGNIYGKGGFQHDDMQEGNASKHIDDVCIIVGWRLHNNAKADI
jgi:hypothetical protein